MTRQLILRETEVDAILGQLPRCHLSLTSHGQKAKAAIPVRSLADFAAVKLKQVVYQCGHHYHLTTPRNTAGSAVKVANFDVLVAETRHRSKLLGMRMYIYGTRTAAGRWRYRARPAMFRDAVVRDGEL